MGFNLAFKGLTPSKPSYTKAILITENLQVVDL
jgi:hypothetical protein